MTRTVVLNNVDHHDLRVILGHSAKWGDAINQVIVFPTEYEELQREYPIVLRREADGRFQSVALLGLDGGENLFLEGGRWSARYVPAARQRAPFRIGYGDEAAAQRGEPVIFVDLDHPRVTGGEGAPVFLPHGGAAPYLEHMQRVLRAIHVGLEMAPAMFEAFLAHDLIEPTRLEISIDEETQYVLDDVYTIGVQRLARLDGAALERLHRAGFLRLAFMLSASLANVTHLIDRKRALRAGALAPAPGAVARG